MMTKGKSWKIDEERKLRSLVAEGKGLDELCRCMGKSRFAIKSKMFDMGLRVGRPRADSVGSEVAPPLELPADLPSIEEKLKVLSAALDALERPGLSRNEVLRLRTIVQGVKTYNGLFAEYVDYRGIENELLEIKAELEEENQRRAIKPP